jgi:hypothetical protein
MPGEKTMGRLKTKIYVSPVFLSPLPGKPDRPRRQMAEKKSNKRNPTF